MHCQLPEFVSADRAVLGISMMQRTERYQVILFKPLVEVFSQWDDVMDLEFSRREYSTAALKANTAKMVISF